MQWHGCLFWLASWVLVFVLPPSSMIGPAGLFAGFLITMIGSFIRLNSNEPPA